MHYQRLEITRLSPLLFDLAIKIIRGTSRNFPSIPFQLKALRFSWSLLEVV